MKFTRHHLTIPESGTTVVALLEDTLGQVHHVTLDAPSERRALLAQTPVLPVFGQARERFRKARAEVEARVFTAAERQLAKTLKASMASEER